MASHCALRSASPAKRLPLEWRIFGTMVREKEEEPVGQPVRLVQLPLLPFLCSFQYLLFIRLTYHHCNRRLSSTSIVVSFSFCPAYSSDSAERYGRNCALR